MTATTLNIYIEQGVDFSQALPVTVNYTTGYTVTAKLRPVIGGTTEFAMTGVVTSATVVTISMVAAATTALTLGRYFYEVDVTSTGGVVTRLYEGQAVVAPGANIVPPTASGRQTLINWCLRSLGHPVVEVNVSDDQIQDRIDEALQFWNLNHFEGSEKFYLTYQITCSTLAIVETNAALYTAGMVLTGKTSGATATIQSNKVNNVIRIRDVHGIFLANEQVTDGVNTSTLQATNFYTPGDTENRWIPIPDYVYGVSRIIPITQPNSSQYIFDVTYQIFLNDVQNLANTDLTYYTQAMNNLDLLAFTLRPVPDFEFNRQEGRLRIDTNWPGRMMTDSYICLEAYRALDPTQFAHIWTEPWLRQYATALIKRQWGANLKKFSGMTLPGGVKIDGNVIYQEAMIEIKQLEEQLMINTAPLSFFMG